jgi:hypothetical protein
MRTRSVTLSVATLLLLTLGCRRKASATSCSARPAAASVYDAGTAADRKATEKDRLFKRWAAAFVRGTPADKGKARAELAGQPPELRAEFEKFC